MQRDVYWDSLKFILIFLVVYVHVLTIDYAAGSINRAIFNFINLFIMPLFVCISGRFSQINDKDRYVKGIIKLVETFFVFQLLQVLCRYITHRGDFSLIHIIIYPEMALWYIQCLVYWRLVILATQRIVLVGRPGGGGKILIISFVMSLLSGFMPIGRELSIQRAFALFPFFMMGYYSRHIDVRSHINKIPMPFCVAFIGISLMCVLLFFNEAYVFLSYAVPYSVSVDLFIRFACMMSAILLSPVVMRVSPSSGRLSDWGRVTLFIYVYHLFFEAIIKMIVKRGILPSGLFWIFIYSVLLTMFLLWLSKSKFFNIIMNPFTFLFYQKCK